jgi:hypothetical protein
MGKSSGFSIVMFDSTGTSKEFDPGVIHPWVHGTNGTVSILNPKKNNLLFLDP